MRTKLTLALAAALVLVAMAPTANASVNDDTLSRMFIYVSGVRAETDGIGWYDTASPPNICTFSLRGIQSPLGGSFYYETGRVYTNLPGFTAGTTLPGLGPIPADCPAIVNPNCTVVSGCAINLNPITVNPLARSIAPQDGLVCSQASGFLTCIPVLGTWWVGSCDWANADFSQTARQTAKGLMAGTGLESLMLSADIDCTSWNDFRDYSFLLGSGGNPLSSGFDGVPVSAEIPFGNGADDTGFLVSCLSADYTTIDTSGAVPVVTQGVIQDGVDWAQILDLDSPAGSGWIGDLLVQFGVNGRALQGLYDLGGDNDCPVISALPAFECSNFRDDSDADVDALVDIEDPQCYSTTPEGLTYYNPRNNE